MNRFLFSCFAVVALTAAADSTPSTQLPDIYIRANSNPLPRKRVDPSSTAVPSDNPLAQSLSSLPGIHLRGLGAHGGEPLVRGLGWERVATRYHGLPLYGACPSRMDPPVNLFHPSDLSAVAVDIGPASVTRGPLKTGGALEITDHLPLPAAAEKRRELSGGIQSDGLARRVALEVEQGAPASAVRGRAGLSRRGDRIAADGTRIPAGRDSRDADIRLAARTGANSTLQAGLRIIEDRDTDYPALPMDSREGDTLIGNLEGTWTPASARLSRLIWRAGIANTDHLMDNRDKPNRKQVVAKTPSNSDSVFGSLLVHLPGSHGEWRTGIDGSRLERDATRTRTMVATGMTFRDPVWPAPVQETSGVFTEWEGPVSPTVSLRMGVRADRHFTDAGRAHLTIVPGPGYGRTTVEEAYRDVGHLSGSVDQEDWLMGGNVRLSMTPTDSWTVHLALGHTEAAPNLSQRYLAFGPIPGGFGIGTPDLSPETKREVEMKVEHTLHGHAYGISLHASQIDSYLLPVTVASLDVNGDGRTDRVRGTVNRDAALWGVEAEADLRLSENLYMPLSLEWVRGEIREDGAPLPEMPPFEAAASLEWKGPGDRQPAVRLDTRYVHKQTRVSKPFGEDATPSFALVHLKAGFSPTNQMRVEVGIRNVLNRTYHEHLDREALMPVGDLSAGDEIPQAGRTFFLTLRTMW